MYIIMKLKSYTRRKELRDLHQTVLHKCGLAELSFLFFFGLFLYPLNALSVLNTSNTSTEEPDSAFYSRYPYVIVIDEGDDADISDEYFYQYAASVIFKVSKWDLPSEDKTLKELSETVLPRISRDSLKIVRVKMRGAASPEGSEKFNKFLSEKRQRALYDFVAERLQIPQGDSLVLETMTEDYTYLYKRMMQDGDPDCEKVKRLFDEYMPRQQYAQLKKALQAVDGGRLWRRMLVTYFPSLRAARMVIVCSRRPLPIVEKPEPTDSIVPIVPIVPIDSMVTVEKETVTWVERYPRRELLSVKSNLLFDFAYVPGYNRWCPIPNVAIEYYPKHGHFTYGFSIDFPWWQHYNDQKYFQIRNYQLEARYYFRSGDIARRPAGEGAAFRGFYLQGYAHAALYSLCFGKKRGWFGEGLGAGLGAGYVLPLSKKGHWRMEFGLQVGWFLAAYDTYQYGNPKTGEEDGWYYYKWTQSKDTFKKRQYRFNWFGPTRVGVTLVYDLLYRRNDKKGFSFRPWEKETRIIKTSELEKTSSSEQNKKGGCP